MNREEQAPLEQQTDGTDLGEALQQNAEHGENPVSAQEKPQPKSLREELLEQFKDIQARPRDAKGRYVRPAKEQAAAIEQPSEANQFAPQQQEPAAPKTQPPTSWSASAKAEFEKLPAIVREAISKREAEVHKGFTSLDEDRNLGKQVKEVVSPYLAMIQAEGGTPATAMKVLLNSAYLLRRGTPQQKLALVSQMCSEYGIPVQALTQFASHPRQAPAPVPQQQVQAPISREDIASIVQQEQHRGRLQSEIAAFQSDPANQHFEQVKSHMAHLLLNGLATDLKGAYEQACWANSEIRSSLMAEQQKAAQDKQRREIQQKSTAARHAGGSVSGGPGASNPSSGAPSNRSLRDEIAANFRAAQGAV
jgi:hypothetical protein